MYVAVVISDKDIQEDKKIMFDNKPPQERLRQQAIKEKEKERQQFYQKQKEGQKDVRAKYREKVLPPSPCYHCHPYSVLLEMKSF